jgi:galactose-1-phosphate uridylyltransferase
MKKYLKEYLKGVKKIDLRKLEKKVEAKVLDPSGKTKKYQIKIRENPAFLSKARIAPARKLRKIETAKKVSTKKKKECFFCDPEKKCAKFSSKKLEKLYYLNDSVVFSNLFPLGEIHGVVVFNYKTHNTDPRNLNLSHWADGINLVQKIGKLTRKKYISFHINYGPKAAASLEHFHGQFHCEDFPPAKTQLVLKTTNKKWWKSWLKTLLAEGLVIDFDPKTKVALYAEWSPVFGKTELVIITLEKPSFQLLEEKEIKTTAKYLNKAIRKIMRISDQFNVINLSAQTKDNFCNQFRVFARAPLAQGVKSWEGYLEFMEETVHFQDPKK